MKSNKKMKTMKKRRTKLTNQYKNTYKNTYKNKKQYGGTVIENINNAVNNASNAIQTGQMTASATVQEQNQEPGDGVVDIVNNAGDNSTPIGKAINTAFNQDGDTTDESNQSNQSNEKSEQLQKYLQYIQNNPSFIQSTLSNIVVKPTAYLINELASLLNVDMNNPDKLKTHLDEMADSIQDPVERNKVLNYNAQVLAVYLSASKPSIDIISGIFSQEVSEILGDVIYNMSTTIQNMIPGLSLFNDIPQMLVSIVQATTTLAQLTSTGATSTQENLQQLNKSIMNEVDVKNKLVIEQKKQAEILEKQNKLVEFILEKPEIIDSYIKYLNKFKNEKITINDIIPNSNKIRDSNLDSNLDLPDTNMTGGRRNKSTTRRNMDKEHDNILNAIKESLNEYNKR
jgi:hypothetical protein